MTVAGRTDCNSGIAIEESVAVDILDPNARSAFSYQLEGGSWV
jgi:hypothetical protein